MKSVLEAIDNRFPCRPNIKFIKPHRRLGGIYHEGEPDFNSYIDYIEVPYEIVKQIYEAGWSDAKDEMKKELAGVTQRMR
jgi:hypothetical protein